VRSRFIDVKKKLEDSVSLMAMIKRTNLQAWMNHAVYYTKTIGAFL